MISGSEPPIVPIPLKDLSQWHPKFEIEQDVIPIPLIEFPPRPSKANLLTTVTSRGRLVSTPLSHRVNLSGYQLRSITPQRLHTSPTRTTRPNPNAESSVDNSPKLDLFHRRLNEQTVHDSPYKISTPLRGSRNRDTDVFKTPPRRTATISDQLDNLDNDPTDAGPFSTPFLTRTPQQTRAAVQSSTPPRKLATPVTKLCIISTTPPRTPLRTPIRSGLQSDRLSPTRTPFRR